MNSQNAAGGGRNHCRVNKDLRFVAWCVVGHKRWQLLTYHTAAILGRKEGVRQHVEAGEVLRGDVMRVTPHLGNADKRVYAEPVDSALLALHDGSHRVAQLCVRLRFLLFGRRDVGKPPYQTREVRRCVGVLALLVLAAQVRARGHDARCRPEGKLGQKGHSSGHDGADFRKGTLVGVFAL